MTSQTRELRKERLSRWELFGDQVRAWLRESMPEICTLSVGSPHPFLQSLRNLGNAWYGRLTGNSFFLPAAFHFSTRVAQTLSNLMVLLPQESASASLGTLAANPHTLVRRKGEVLNVPGLVIETQLQARAGGFIAGTTRSLSSSLRRRRSCCCCESWGIACSSERLRPTMDHCAQGTTALALASAAAASQHLDRGLVAGQSEVRQTQPSRPAAPVDRRDSKRMRG